MIRIGSLLIFLVISLFAGVSATVDNDSIFYGESVNLKISAEGEDIEFPDINEIAGYRVEGKSTSTQIRIINGTKSYQKELLLTFTPLQSVTIPSFNIVINKRNNPTPQIHIDVSKGMKNKSGKTRSDDFIYLMEIQKTKAYVGEPLLLSLKFKKRDTAQLIDIEFYEPKFENFWTKKIGKEKQYEENGYTIYELKYLVYPQKKGKLSISPTYLKIAIPQLGRDTFGFSVNIPQFKKVYSNGLDLDIEALPDGVELIGDYEMRASVNKKEVQAGEAVNFTIKIEGEGNIDDIRAQKLDIPNTTIYSDSPKITTSLDGDRVVGQFEQTFAIIANSDFTIPPLNIKYFNHKTGEVKMLSSEGVDIKVNSQVQNQVSKIETMENQPKIQQDENMLIEEKYIFLLLGLFGGIVIMMLIKLLGKSEKKEKTLKQKTQSKNKELIKRFMPFVKNPEVKKFIDALERNEYHKESVKFNKKEALKLLERLEKK